MGWCYSSRESFGSLSSVPALRCLRRKRFQVETSGRPRKRGKTLQNVGAGYFAHRAHVIFELLQPSRQGIICLAAECTRWQHRIDLQRPTAETTRGFHHQTNTHRNLPRAAPREVAHIDAPAMSFRRHALSWCEAHAAGANAATTAAAAAATATAAAATTTTATATEPAATEGCRAAAAPSDLACETAPSLSRAHVPQRC